MSSTLEISVRDSPLEQFLGGIIFDLSDVPIFVHGLGWDTTREVLVSAFEPFGEVEDSNLVMDKLTGKAKGYGFVLFKTRRAALKALRKPRKTIGGRCASCQLTSVSPGTNTNTNAAATPSES
ncbi:PREDICTED: UBP1-associated proteins 1A-like [Fragaria vesca subsp. vesca]|uniref:UBP1-associated proteins 1A-like n=1 Tax=Fragaria vesca subsp. vesca TaxID=101020 RepID=UPI0002C31722|nr:PREDICTED: UBP1-associated proteins 1A-like [Fragaria vesca subsp. vesca]